MISFSCLHCGAAIKAKVSSAGLKGKCKKCGKVVVVPTSVVEDPVSAIDEWESSDWGGGSDEQDPYTKIPNPRRTGKTLESKSGTSIRFRRLMTFAFVFASAAGLVVSLGVAFVLIGKWSSGFDDGDAFRDLDRSAAELSTALKLGIDREDYGRLVRQMALEIDLAGRRVKSPEGQKLIRLFGELRDIYADAGEVWDVKLNIPMIRAEAEKRQKFLSFAPGNNVEPYLEFKNQVTRNGIPMKDFARKSTGLDDIAERYALPITTTKSDFKIIPMDSVERILAVAREKKDEVDALQTTP
jgi:hypothetical protein